MHAIGDNWPIPSGAVVRKRAPLLVGCLIAATVLTACTTGTTGAAESAAVATSSQVDIQSTGTPQQGDCVGNGGGNSDGQVWTVSCANRNAVARVTKQVPPAATRLISPVSPAA